MDSIRIRGARTHNLKNIDLDLPRDRLIVLTGLSGSGKSSLAFDTIYAEGQRRYVESLSAYARQFLSVMEKPDIDHIEGLSPAISIEQKTTSHNPRSTVGTITEIHDYLRLLFARVGEPALPASTGRRWRPRPSPRWWIRSWPSRRGRGSCCWPRWSRRARASTSACWRNCTPRASCAPASMGTSASWTTRRTWTSSSKHDIEVVIDRFRVRADLRLRLAESIRDRARALRHGLVAPMAWIGRRRTPTSPRS